MYCEQPEERSSELFLHPRGTQNSGQWNAYSRPWSCLYFFSLPFLPLCISLEIYSRRRALSASSRLQEFHRQLLPNIKGQWFLNRFYHQLYILMLSKINSCFEQQWMCLFLFNKEGVRSTKSCLHREVRRDMGAFHWRQKPQTDAFRCNQEVLWVGTMRTFSLL